ncbi:endonuclease/exonuclease/phosphatase family protein [Vibrio fluminensis]|uniref:endonuclease/exonuclease/phosphatase family protein n=1 Tax=Vibrio fluminensis TaxID=2783614 RepID=UPI001E2E1EB0|nr:endonuclease/exonuclease/phosphatase family protein [Vibrio fluminensis]
MMMKNPLFKLHAKPLIFLYIVALTAFEAQAEQSFKVSTWNMEWFVSEGNERFAPSLRNSDDFYKMAHYFNKVDTSILAFQEVGDAAALEKLIGDKYTLYMSDRALAMNSRLQYDDINQYTGFAVRNDATVQDVDDFSLLPAQRHDKLRFASYIIVKPSSDSPIHLLNVHLKARCSGRYENNRACQTLKLQGEALNQWIREREANVERYMIVGDFNHNLSFNRDWLWQILSKSTDAVLATRHVNAECKVRSRKNPNRTHQFRSLIDHVVTSRDINIIKIEQNLYQSQDVMDYQLSDHCPITATLK